MLIEVLKFFYPFSLLGLEYGISTMNNIYGGKVHVTTEHVISIN